ncbi:uncharacterized protein JN550_008391 [Neoarthrinium moseri]|uniref:uncharacterized protein n=1 Tax=Neoarthrinium moseri TaxID=1658444 RepID=UPI001FDB2BFB|nr:uncharacterized protein JN550_008391 [Neoarthrinium moseri]KAI1865343.1 hypothetical protein JN550_008391 [Neoarthrinium moseri]
MASRSSRYDPKYDDPYVSHRAYPDSHAGVGDDAFEYVGSDAFPEPPPHTFEGEEPRSSRRHRSSRASTLPPNSSGASPPPRSRRGGSPPHRSSRHHSSSPPRHRRSRRDDSPPRKSSKTAADAAAAGAVVGAAAAATAAAAGSPSSPKQDRFGRWVNRPALKKNMKTYSRKGLNTLGDVVQAYAAAQNPQLARGRSAGPGYGGRYDDYHDDPYDRPRRRRHYSISPSPSPPPPRRRASAKDSDRRRPPLHGRQKSYSVSPARTRGYDSDEDRRHRRRSRRYSVSPSPSPQRRRHRSHSHRRGSETPTRGSQSRREFYKNEMKSPNPDVAHRWQLAARAALEAGGVTAFRLRKEPGSWTGQKGAKVATAALGAAAIDAFIDKDPRRTKAGGVKGMAESVVGGLVASKLMGFQSATTRKGKPRVF